MAGASTKLVLTYIDTLFRLGTVAGTADGELLDRFVSGPREVSGAAFAALVERHGAMVLRVCQKVLRDPHDAEDASQAAFLILARKARSIRQCNSVASWLFGVAHRVALRARTQAARRRQHEKRAAEMRAQLIEQKGAEKAWPALYEELERLPEKLRTPLVLCYLEGLTVEQAACDLRWSARTLHRRLEDGRERLRTRLARRGLVAPSVVMGAGFSAALKESTVQAATQLTTGTVVAGTISAAVEGLTREVMRTLMLNNLKMFAAGVLALGIVAGGAATLAQQAGVGRGHAAVNQGRTKDDGKRLALQETKIPDPQKQVDARPRTGETLRALLVEKRDLLRQLVETSRRLFEGGELALEEMLRAKPALLEAELKLAETRRDRLAILEAMLGEAKQLEEVIRQRWERGEMTQTAVVNSKIFRLDAQIRLEEEKLKGDKAAR
ncbi:MAG TPA: RNA polymerase sigma factor [Isosphaeraceae bacterium]|nr:RNA polymerase sigma factor [Isosphaeraceae bacterium]